MDKDLSHLILTASNKDALWPYINLRAIYARDGKVTPETASKFVDSMGLKLLAISGFIQVTDDSIILKREDGSWLYLPENPEKRPGPNKSNRDAQLERIATVAGWPVDFEKNRGYYNAQFNRLLVKYGFDKIEIIAYNNRGIGLKALLTNGIFKSLLVKFEAESLD